MKMVCLRTVAGLFSFCNSQTDKKRPNILFLIADDQSWEYAGCYGDKAVRTPVIDKLAHEGVQFNHAYCAAPSCSPSRAGILTGQDIYRLEEGRVVNDPVSLIDLAPTFLQLADVEVSPQMIGRDLSNLLFSTQSGKIDKNREFVVTAFEEHTSCRRDVVGFPRRALHTEQWTYVNNYEPDRWPAGDPDVMIPEWGMYGDIDPSEIKSFFLEHRDKPGVRPLFKLWFGKVPAEELYNKKEDPDMINNLALDTNYQKILKKFREKLQKYLKETDDPRLQGKLFRFN